MTALEQWVSGQIPEPLNASWNFHEQESNSLQKRVRLTAVRYGDSFPIIS